VPKCLCLFAELPYLEEFRHFLTELYRLSLSVMHVPIERYICNFLQVGMPPSRPT
jgi:hypothetical protein